MAESLCWPKKTSWATKRRLCSKRNLIMQTKGAATSLRAFMSLFWSRKCLRNCSPTIPLHTRMKKIQVKGTNRRSQIMKMLKKMITKRRRVRRRMNLKTWRITRGTTTHSLTLPVHKKIEYPAHFIELGTLHPNLIFFSFVIARAYI